MATPDDFLEYAYSSNDAAKAEQAAEIAKEDARRLELLAQFADAKLIVTTLRKLEEASAGRLVASFEAQHYSDNPTVTIKIRDARVADRVMTNRASLRDESHGFRLLVNAGGVTLKMQKDEDYFLRHATAEELPFSENGLVRISEINGTNAALTQIFHWAGHTKDEAGEWYIERPKVYPVNFRRDKPEPTQ